MAGTYGNRTHQEPVSKPLIGFEDRAGHQPRTRSPRRSSFWQSGNHVVQSEEKENEGLPGSIQGRVGDTDLTGAFEPGEAAPALTRTSFMIRPETFQSCT